MEILVSGSLAYDRIMDFPGLFSDHIMPDKIHNINVSFTVNGLAENFGGTAGNIAYALALLGESPSIISSIGHDYHRYFQRLDQHGLTQKHIRIVPEESTASAYITTDEADNQITGFNPGAMKFPSGADIIGLDPSDSIAIVAPGNLEDMQQLSRQYKDQDIFTIFDPGQSLPLWDGSALSQCINGSQMLVCNDYEQSLIASKTGLKPDELLGMVDTVIVTLGAQGCQVSTKENSVRVPAIPTDNVVDPTGAGDAFRGGLIKGLVLGLPVRRAAEMGTACAHYAVQQQGTQQYSMSAEHFQETLQRHFGPHPAP